MLIKMRTIIAGPNINAKAGDIVALPDTQAQELIKAGYAESVEEVPAITKEETIETATQEQPSETAAKRGGRPKKK